MRCANGPSPAASQSTASSSWFLFAIVRPFALSSYPLWNAPAIPLPTSPPALTFRYHPSRLLVTATEQMPKELVPSIESQCRCPKTISCRKPDWRAAFPRPDEKDCPSDNRHRFASRFSHTSAPGFQEQLPILIRQENRLPPIPTIHHMINRSFVFNPQLARHAATLSGPCKHGNSQYRPFIYARNICFASLYLVLVFRKRAFMNFRQSDF